MGELWQKVESPFVQAITDNFAAKCVFPDGKVMLVGDAVAGLRPHTTAGTNQAALHALVLKKVFEKGSAMSVVRWEQKILE
jgi:2-polyprenyl-6-methoxyphenol hydroxylase-like FAD-dependent oxidoreductase